MSYCLLVSVKSKITLQRTLCLDAKYVRSRDTPCYAGLAA